MIDLKESLSQAGNEIKSEVSDEKIFLAGFAIKVNFCVCQGKKNGV